MKQTKRILSICIDRLIDTDPDPSYLEQEGFEDRLAEYRSGDFGFIGIRAIARVCVNGIIQTLHSGGLWGIEDDSSEQYLCEIEQEELTQLRTELYSFGFSKRAIATAIREM